MNVSILYVSMSGNTTQVANIIENELIRRDFNVSSVNIQNDHDNYDDLINKSDIIYLGSYSWGNGQIPLRFRSFLKHHLKIANTSFPPVGVFGTGETQWTHFCRAVDEIKYHILERDILSLGELKIEQSPINGQHNKVIEFVNKTLKEFNNIEN